MQTGTMVRADREWELGLSEMRKRAPIRLNMEIEKIYKQMIGHTIIGFEMEKDEEGNDWPVFTVEKTYQSSKTTATKVRHKLVISRDPEGNGPGFVFLEAGEDEYITIPETN